MGNNRSGIVCTHKELNIQPVRGLDFNDYQDQATCYPPDFAHLTCSKCKLDFYGVKHYYYSWWSKGPVDDGWEIWHPTSESEKHVFT